MENRKIGIIGMGEGESAQKAAEAAARLEESGMEVINMKEPDERDIIGDGSKIYGGRYTEPFILENYDQYVKDLYPPTPKYARGRTVEPVRTAEKIGRNQPCPCGSGKKYKKCCG